MSRVIPTMCVLLVSAADRSVAQDATTLQAKAAETFQRNQQMERYWTWTSTETWTVTYRSGKTLFQFPAVTLDSLIKQDGSRCNAVAAWSDKVKPHLSDSDADSRCRATDDQNSKKFDVVELLKASKVQLDANRRGITLTLFPNKDRQRDPDQLVRCAASIRATLLLDRADFFPRRIEGQVTGDGCDGRGSVPPTYYGEKQAHGITFDTFRKGSTFLLEYELQPDRFDGPNRRIWLLKHWTYNSPADWRAGDSLFYWGREITYTSRERGHRLRTESSTIAQQFGVQSRIVP